MNEGILFWNVDTQVDFIEPYGKMYVKDAGNLKPILAKITSFAADNEIRVINTCDFHFINSNELSGQPDFVSSFPQHCMAGSSGSEFISETKPHLPAIVDWMTHLAILPQLANARQYRNIVIRKDAFDVFEGNPYTNRILELLQPEKVFIYGLIANFSVDRAAYGLVQLGYKVFVFEDAIKALPGLPLPYEAWEKWGVQLIRFEDVRNYF